MDLTAHWQVGKCQSVECFVAAVTTFLTNHFSALHLPDPSQIGLTCSHSVPPIVFCAYRRLPLRSGVARTLSGSHSATRTPRAPPLDTAWSRQKSSELLFSRRAWKVGFPFSNFYLPGFSAAAVFWPVNLAITVCVCVCSVPLRAALMHAETSEITFPRRLLIPKTEAKTSLRRVRTFTINCAFVCVQRSANSDTLFTLCVCFLSVCACINDGKEAGVHDSRWSRVKDFLLKKSVFVIQPAFDGSRIESVTLKALM